MRTWASIIVLSIAGSAGFGTAWAAGAADHAASEFAHGDYEAALAAWRPAAEAGDARAQFGLGLLYFNGWGVGRDPLAAQRWYSLSAEGGEATAQYNLAVMRETGSGVPRDIARAAFWYGEAARQGLAAAANNLALMTLEGEGLERDAAKAIALLEHAGTADRQHLIEALPIVHAVRLVDMRARPTSDSRRVGGAAPLSAARSLAQKQDWVQVWLYDHGKVGWVARGLLRGVPVTHAPRLALSALARGPLTSMDRTSTPTLRTEDEAAGAMPATQTAMATPRLQLSLQTNAREGRLLRNAGWIIHLGDVLPKTPAPRVSIPEPEPDPGGDRLRVATDTLNVRQRPSRESPVIATLDRDEIVHVQAVHNGWRRIGLARAAESGWVAAFLLSDQPPGEPPPAPFQPRPAKRSPAPTVAPESVGRGGG